MARIPLLAVLALLLVVGSARADILELDDGRLVEGVVVKTDDAYHVQSRFGPTTNPATRVRRHVEARSVDEQIREHVASLADDDAENRALLAQWLVELGREEEGKAMARAVLELDPESAVAHKVLGHIRHQGLWRTPDEAKRAEGLEKHGDRWYTPQEWANQGKSVREKALEREKQLAKERLQDDVNRAVRLMLSPDPGLRKRGRALLDGMAKEYDDASLAELARNVDAYVRKLDEMAAASALAVGPGGVSGTGTVMGDFRATMSKLKRPIETFTTSLAGGPFAGAPVKIQLPELEVVRVRTVGAIPVVVK